MKVMLLSNFATAYCLVGKMDDSKKYWNRAVARAKKIDHEMSIQYAYILIRTFRVIEGKV
jgi:hypothetical protein